MTRFEYSISVPYPYTSLSKRITSSAIIDAFHVRDIEVPSALNSLVNDGCRYSFQDFDVLSSAVSDLYRHDTGIWDELSATR